MREWENIYYADAVVTMDPVIPAKIYHWVRNAGYRFMAHIPMVDFPLSKREKGEERRGEGRTSPTRGEDSEGV